MKSVDLFIDCDVSESIRVLRKPVRERIILFLRELKLEPETLEGYSEPDDTDRSIQIKILGRYAIHYWYDSPVREIKIIGLSSADRY